MATIDIRLKSSYFWKDILWPEQPTKIILNTIAVQGRTMPLADAHIHLTDREILQYIDSVITTLKAMKIKVCSVCVDNRTSLASIDLLRDATIHNIVSQFVGVHPQCAKYEDVSAFEHLLRAHIQSVDGIGEIGLDRTYSDEFSPYTKQLQVFETMLCLAENYSRPISVHSRESLNEILEIISSYNIPTVLIHWFSGNKRQLRICMDRGYYVSYGPPLLYSKDKSVLLGKTHKDKILIETDGPNRYTHCFDNQPALPSSFLASVAKSVGEVLLMPYDETVEMLSTNWSQFTNHKL